MAIDDHRPIDGRQNGTERHAPVHGRDTRRHQRARRRRVDGILLDLGVRDMIVMSSTRPEPTAIEGYGLRIVGWRDMDGEDKT